VDYSQIDSQLAPQGKGLGVICTSDYLSDWENLSKEEYKTKKEEMARILTERLNKVIPGIKDEIEYCEVATPKTIKRYTLNPGGTVYGFAQIPKQAGRKRIQQKSPVENLYFASAWTFPAGGFTGAILSGYRCAEEILDRKGTK
jgi:phytoene dehydrogenase-like protein